MAVKFVSGYVPLRVRHRTEEEYRVLGKKLLFLPLDIAHFQWTLEQCWLWQYLQAARQSVPIIVTDGGDPNKNTLDYLIVQHQKVDWMLRAALADPRPDVFVWVDYGVFHMGDLKQDILDFAKRVDSATEITIPGCWPMGQDGGPCWRFCGTVLVCPREHLVMLDTAIKTLAVEKYSATNTITWEVNTWADVERNGLAPIKWYPANHDRTLFTNYPGA